MKLLITALSFGLSFTLFAHPVSFEGSKGIMGHHSGGFVHNQVNYSYKYWFAPGLHYFKRNNMNYNAQASAVSANFLLKRWNGEAHQANIYTLIGAGKSSLSSEEKDIGLTGIQFDIEDRKYYFLAKHMSLHNKDNIEYQQNTLRAGVAPYVGPFDDIHTWFILEHSVTRFAGENPSQDTTPFLRVFYKNVLFEIGQSIEGQSKFNYIIHF